MSFWGEWNLGRSKNTLLFLKGRKWVYTSTRILEYLWRYHEECINKLKHSEWRWNSSCYNWNKIHIDQTPLFYWNSP